jgi:hypothetical protein
VRVSAVACPVLDRGDVVEHLVERGGEALVDGLGGLGVESARDEHGSVAIALEE